MNDTPAGCAHRVGFASVARRIYAADLSAGFKEVVEREDVTRGAHVGRDSRVRHPCRSRGWKGNASLDPRPRNVTNL